MIKTIATKLTTIAIAASFFAGFAVLAAPGVSSAQTVTQTTGGSGNPSATVQAQIRAELQSLLEELQQLEALVAAMENNNSSSVSSASAPVVIVTPPPTAPITIATSTTTTSTMTSSTVIVATTTIINSGSGTTSTYGFSFVVTPLGQTTSRVKSTSDPLATLSFSGSSAGTIAINQLAITFSGAAAAPSLLQTGAVRLLDQNNQPLGLVVTTSTSGGNYVWSFDLGAATSANAQGVISAGTSEKWTLVVNDFDLAQATGQGSVNLVASINANSDLQYTDGLSSSATAGLTIPSSILTPLELNSVVFAQGT